MAAALVSLKFDRKPPPFSSPCLVLGGFPFLGHGFSTIRVIPLLFK